MNREVTTFEIVIGFAKLVLAIFIFLVSWNQQAYVKKVQAIITESRETERKATP